VTEHPILGAAEPAICWGPKTQGEEYKPRTLTEKDPRIDPVVMRYAPAMSETNAEEIEPVVIR
jgi:hypothetical protein